MFADDTTLMAESESNLQRYVSAFVRVCERKKLKINVGKSKVIKLSNTGERYLGVDFASKGRMDGELNHKSMEVRKCADVLKSVWKNRKVSMETKRNMHEEIVEPTTLYVSEAWVLENKVKNRIDVAEMSCVRSMCGVRRRDRLKNEKIRRRCGLQRSLSKRGEAAVLRRGGLDRLKK